MVIFLFTTSNDVLNNSNDLYKSSLLDSHLFLFRYLSKKTSVEELVFLFLAFLNETQLNYKNMTA
jgi:hypothetical protein